MVEPNDQLRAARERVESPSTPGMPLTRQELADLVNAQVYRATGKVVAIEANHIGKWERGVIRWPAAHYRAALRIVFDVATDSDLGFRPPRRGNVEDVDRKTFLRAALGAGATVAVHRLAAHSPTLSNDLATAVAGPTAHYRRMESDVPSAQLAQAVEAHYRLAGDIVRDQLRTPTGYGALSEIAGLSAWLAADRGDNQAARRRYGDAIRYAESAGHPLLAAYMTASLGHFAVEVGDPRQGLILLQRATAQLDGDAPSTARAWLASLHSIAHAALGDRRAAVDALHAAERQAGRRGSEARWPWVFTFDAARVARYQTTTLARLGDVTAARASYDEAAPSLTSPKPRALAKVDYAGVLAASGQVAEGCQLATEALQVGGRYSSERITARVRGFRATLPPRTIEARALDDALTALYERETV